MKKLLIVLVLLIAGASFYTANIGHSQDAKALSPVLKKNIPFHEVKPTPEMLQVETITQRSTEYEEFQEKYQDLSIDELERELSELEAYSKEMNLFSRANSGNLDASTTLEITEFLRKDTVLRHLILEHKLDELESEYL
jgi:hypothetical protein